MFMDDRFAGHVEHLAARPLTFGGRTLGPGRPHISSDKVIARAMTVAATVDCGCNLRERMARFF